MTYPKDKVDGQHWTTVRELWMKKDKEQCESWKDEVQNILIFSGLFSAIVTAFLIESQRALRPNFAEESVQLLRQIAGLGGEISVKSRVNHDAVTNSINIFWFLSLVLSLTAALIGIIALQWIRTHLQSLSDGSDSLGISHMHSLGLQKSHIPRIFDSLPVILILGLALFLVGLVVFLFQLSWLVAIPVTVAILLTFVFVLTTTCHPALQSLPAARPSNEPDSFPSPYRSPQSLLFLRFVTFLKQLRRINYSSVPNDRDPESNNHAVHGAQRRYNLRLDLRGDWTSRSRIWIQKRKSDFASSGYDKQLSHLEEKWDGIEAKPFAYDIVQALISVKERKIAETEKESTALAHCLADVLPIHLDLFQTKDLADLIPFLPPSKFFPSSLILRGDLATREDLGAIALLQIASCKGRPKMNSALIRACVLSTRWLFEQPRTFDSAQDSQPLNLINNYDKLTLDHLEVLIATLTRFFSFASDFRPNGKIINSTTHTSSYTYWFLDLSARILTRCFLSDFPEMENRYAYMLHGITIHLNKKEEHNCYLFFTASIYASTVTISTASGMSSPPFWADFLRAVDSYRDDLIKRNPNYQNLPLCKALKADEVIWNSISSRISCP